MNAKVGGSRPLHWAALRSASSVRRTHKATPVSGDSDDEGRQRRDAAADGEKIPPKADLRAPAADPWQRCPVMPLGMNDGMTHWLDYRGQYRGLPVRQLAIRAELLGLIGSDTPWLLACFPQRAARKVDGEFRDIVTGWSLDAAMEWFLKVAAEQPMFGPHIVIRRPGVWPGENGEPVAHCGDVLWIEGDVQPAGLRTGNMIWPAHPALGRPGEPCGPHVGKHLQMEMQRLWRWRQRGGAIMALGVIASAMLGACARWRPSMFFGGDVGGGKTYLLDLLCACCVLRYHSTDTTKAGLEHNLAGRAMPSFVDEASDQVDQRGAQNLLNLITSSAGGEGAKIARGTGDGKGRTAEMVGAVIMASVAPPDMQPQHHERVALIELQAPEAGEDHRADMDALIAFAKANAPAIWSRLLTGFKRYVLALAAYHDALGRAGCGPRQMDQLGAILAGWWVLTEDQMPDDRGALDGVAAVADFVLRAEEVADRSGARQVAERLAVSQLRRDRSTELVPLGEMAVRAWQVSRNPEFGEQINSLEINGWHRDLERNGIRAIRAADELDRHHRPIPRGGAGDGLWLHLHSPALIALFDGTPWSGQRWSHMLQGLPSVIRAPNKVRIGAINPRAVIWISRADLLGEDPEA